MKKILVVVFSCWVSISFAQLSSIQLHPGQNGKPLKELLSSVASQNNLNIYYNSADILPLTCYGINENEYFSRWLPEYLNAFSLRIIRYDKSTLIIVDDRLYSEFGSRNSNYKISSKSPSATKKHQISGRILSANGEPLIGAQVILTNLETGTITDYDGNYSINVPEGVHKLEFKYLGFQPVAYVVCLNGPIKISPEMKESYEQLEELVVTATAENDNVMSEVAGVETMNIETIKTLPTFMGEIDPIKSISSLPGVSSGELSSGFNVRGGDSGQNLILQDEAIIFNPSHLFGFFSAFNPDMVSNVELFKGGGPAAYGGRVSSTLDISLRDGNKNEFRAKGGLGLISSRATIETPVIKEKSSLIFGGRMAYPNWLIGTSDDIEIKNNEAGFYDMTLRYHHSINKNNIISVSAYHSHDDFLFAADSAKNEWETLNFSLGWINSFSSTSTLRVFLSNSNYYSKIEDSDNTGRFSASNGYKNVRLKTEVESDWSTTLSSSVGLEINHYTINPGDLKPASSTEGIEPVKVDDHIGLESAIFGQVGLTLPGMAFMAGIRASTFQRFGPGTIYEYDYSNISGNLPTVTDSTNYSSGEMISSNLILEPRLSMRINVSPTTSIKASYYRASQYLHLISNTAASIPQDYWIASGKQVKPQIGNQFSVGVFKNFRDNKWNVSVEPFYKIISNSLDYTDGLDITQNPLLEGGLVQGKGKAYGVEAQINKNGEKFNGWIAYTFSRSLRQFTGREELPAINQGHYYPSNFDKPHNISLVTNYNFNERVSLSMNFSYITGQPVTIPVTSYRKNTIPAVLIYSERNEYRMPDYHRLDLSLTVKEKDIRNKKIKGEWNFSLFNVYGRKNAYSVYFDQYGGAIKLYVLGNIFPSISYNFEL